MPGRSFTSGNQYRYSFNGMEKDDEVKGITGSSYDFGARMYDSRLGRWFSLDPAAAKYTNLSPYSFTANSPIWFVELDGRVFDLSNLSESEKQSYQAKIEVLSSNKLFQAYYSRLENSETIYYIKAGAGEGGSGSYNTTTREIYSVNNIEALAQEMFHAYQSDLGIYSPKDMSVRETEGDLVSSNIASTVGTGLSLNYSSWDQGISKNNSYYDDNYIFDEGVLTEEFDVDFNKAVDARIDFYKKREVQEGAKAPYGYIQPNSGSGAQALKKVIREANAENLTGPRLPNGDYYEN